MQSSVIFLLIVWYWMPDADDYHVCLHLNECIHQIITSRRNGPRITVLVFQSIKQPPVTRWGWGRQARVSRTSTYHQYWRGCSGRELVAFNLHNIVWKATIGGWHPNQELVYGVHPQQGFCPRYATVCFHLSMFLSRFSLFPLVYDFV